MNIMKELRFSERLNFKPSTLRKTYVVVLRAVDTSMCNT